MDYVTILKEFGFPIALCAALLWAITRQNQMLVKAYTDRIKVLEGLVHSLGEKVAELEADRIRRSDEYGHTIKDLALRWSTTLRDHNELTRAILEHLRRLTDAIVSQPCQQMAGRKAPSSSELPPAPPAQAPTDRIVR